MILMSSLKDHTNSAKQRQGFQSLITSMRNILKYSLTMLYSLSPNTCSKIFKESKKSSMSNMRYKRKWLRGSIRRWWMRTAYFHQNSIIVCMISQWANMRNKQRPSQKLHNLMQNNCQPLLWLIAKQQLKRWTRWSLMS